MNITQHTDYALRVLIYLGACPERRATIKEISDRFEISRSHLMKIRTVWSPTDSSTACAARAVEFASIDHPPRFAWAR